MNDVFNKCVRVFSCRCMGVENRAKCAYLTIKTASDLQIFDTQSEF